MNRDERRTRAHALPPREVSAGKIPALIPVDGEAGGSWISVNALGHTLGLLNRYAESPEDDPGPWISRGLLLSDLAGLPDPGGVEAALRLTALQNYRPFTLASVAVESDPRLFEWDGRELSQTRVSQPGLLRTSSGRDQAGAERERGALFREAASSSGGLSVAGLGELHRSHLPERGPLSICMHREEAVTVSCSLIAVSPSLVWFRYIVGSPCESTVSSDHSLPRLTPAQP